MQHLEVDIMAKKLELNVGKGFTFEDNQLTLDIETSAMVEKRSNGIYAHDTDGNPGASGHSREDNYTIIMNDAQQLQTNSDVVEYIFSMNAYKVIERTRVSVDTYSVDNTQVKTIQDIINELNACIDASSGSNNGCMYILKQNNLFQLKTSVNAMKLSSWPVAIDQMKREPNDACIALFYVESITYSTTLIKPNEQPCYCRSLTLKCLWSSVQNFEVGTSYSANSIHEY